MNTQDLLTLMEWYVNYCLLHSYFHVLLPFQEMSHIFHYTGFLGSTVTVKFACTLRAVFLSNGYCIGAAYEENGVQWSLKSLAKMLVGKRTLLNKIGLWSFHELLGWSLEIYKEQNCQTVCRWKSLNSFLAPLFDWHFFVLNVKSLTKPF